MTGTRLYTGKGDTGSTDLLGERVEKDDPRIDLLGALDETSSSLGLARAMATADGTKETLIATQRDLYQIMAELAFTAELRPASLSLAEARVTWLEETTDALTAEVNLPPQFVLPGETVAGATLDVARTVARRAERQAVALAHTEQVTNPRILQYLNRLSSLLFILARFEDHVAGMAPLLARDRARPSSP